MDFLRSLIIYCFQLRMTNFVPIFPLATVIYPGEAVNLHIFEPRYKQLINDCSRDGKSFGIPTVVNNKLQELGTLVKVVEIVKTYDNGEMDIRIVGQEVFRILEIVKSLPEKLYMGAIVNYPQNQLGFGSDNMKKIIAAIKEMHKILNIQKDFKKEEESLTSYDVAHHIGLSLEEEYELLGLLFEAQRQEYIKRHLSKAIPILQEAEVLKEKVKLNGHFKNLNPFDIDGLK